MRRATLLALLVLALPMAALANVLYSISSTQFVNGIATSTFSLNFTVEMRGAVPGIPGFLTIRTDGIGNLSPGCSTSPGMCTFSGSGDVRAISSLATLFTGTVTSGEVIRGPGNLVTVIADFAPNSMAPVGGFAKWSAPLVGSPSPNSLGPGTAQIVAVPEPGTLGLLGAGVIGLAGMVRRRLKLGT